MNMQTTYTLAQRHEVTEGYTPVQGIPKNMTLSQAQKGAQIARDNGLDVVAFNTRAA